jgi:hypothetical protein
MKRSCPLYHWLISIFKMKKLTPHRVAIVLDRNFGSKVIELSQKMHAWICDTPVNKKAAKSVWSKNKNPGSPEQGVTIFKVSSKDTPESMLIDKIELIDLHHGEYSHNPPWSELHVYGFSLTARIKSKFKYFGDGRFESTKEGFIFFRK